MKKCLVFISVFLITCSVSAQIRFVDAAELNLIGKALPTPHPYHRIDTIKYKGFTKSENQQVRCSAGLALVFRTNSSRLEIKADYTDYTYKGVSTPRVATEGFDLYIRKNDEWVYAASNASKKKGDKFTLISHMDSTEKECLLYLPNYSELKSLKIGIDNDSAIISAENPFRHKIVIFGSSYTHGISTSRSGMSYPMQIGRNTGLYFCNIACSGNSKLQTYFAEYLSDVSDADAMVFDAFSNPSAEEIEERLIPFVKTIRKKLPDTPLIFVQTVYREGANFNLKVRRTEEGKRLMAKKMMSKVMEEFKNVHYLEIENLTGTDHMTSADGIHPSDLGYWRWAKNLEPHLIEVLSMYNIR